MKNSNLKHQRVNLKRSWAHAVCANKQRSSETSACLVSRSNNVLNISSSIMTVFANMDSHQFNDVPTGSNYLNSININNRKSLLLFNL